MQYDQDIKPISYIKTKAADMLKQVNSTHRPIVITQNGEAKAVLLDTKSYQDMTKALGILGLLSQGERDVDRGDLESQDKTLDDLKKSLNERI